MGFREFSFAVSGRIGMISNPPNGRRTMTLHRRRELRKIPDLEDYQTGVFVSKTCKIAQIIGAREFFALNDIQRVSTKFTYF